MKSTYLFKKSKNVIHPFGSFLIIVLLIFTFGSCSDPADGNGAYKTGKYRNLFVENGHSQEEVNAKIEGAFQQLFHGDSAQVIYFEDGENENGKLAYLADINSNDVRSEGMSYGMMICVQMDKKEEFDALWNWALTHMYVDEEGHPNKGYFSWSIFYNGTPRAETPAPDGEEYFAMALYFAANRWGNAEGIYNYKTWADQILTDVRHREVITGPTLQGERSIGSMVSEEHNMILFVPDIGRNGFTDPSYHLPGFYELWARWGPEEDREFWAIAADTSRAFFYKHVDPNTGLCTDYANFDGSIVESRFNRRAMTFAYDSWRTQSNWAFDWSWWQKDLREVELSNRLQSFFASFGVETFGHRFTQEGEVLDSTHRAGLVSTSAVLSLAADHEVAKEFVEEFWNTPVPESHGDRYYDGTLYMMSLLHCSGQFKIWKPE
ncbi:MAG: glycoside hydrolase [Mariniphaga sp.]|nr:glycoside hydrolase [Mariniphaga sp.]